MSPMIRALRIALLPLAACTASVYAETPLSLTQAITLALEHNHDARLARIAIDSAAAERTQAQAAPNPTLSVETTNINPNAGVGGGSLRGKTVDTVFRIDQLIERGGKRRLRGEAAAQLERAVRDDAADVRRQLRREVSVAYFDLLAAQERVKILNEIATLSERTLDAGERRQRAGDLAGSDTQRLRIEALRAQNDADGALAELTQSRRALALLLGGASADLPVATGAWPTKLTAPAGVQSVIDRRADVRAAKARVDAAQSGRKLAAAQRTRDVTVGVQFEHYPVSAANPQGSGNSYGIAVQVPLFVRYGMEGEVRAAEAALDAASESLLRVRQIAQAEADQAAADARANADRLSRFEQGILPAARKAAEAGEFAFVRGAVGVMDVLDTRRTYRAAELDALTARADFAKSLAAFDAAILDETGQ